MTNNGEHRFLNQHNIKGDRPCFALKWILPVTLLSGKNPCKVSSNAVVFHPLLYRTQYGMKGNSFNIPKGPAQHNDFRI